MIFRFCLFRNSDGQVSIVELYQTYRTMGYDITLDICEKTVACMDKDGDRLVSLEEYE